jgi:hypothetical protein
VRLATVARDEELALRRYSTKCRRATGVPTMSMPLSPSSAITALGSLCRSFTLTKASHSTPSRSRKRKSRPQLSDCPRTSRGPRVTLNTSNHRATSVHLRLLLRRHRPVSVSENLPASLSSAVALDAEEVDGAPPAIASSIAGLTRASPASGVWPDVPLTRSLKSLRPGGGLATSNPARRRRGNENLKRLLIRGVVFGQ